jgi:chemotaxis protein MotD
LKPTAANTGIQDPFNAPGRPAQANDGGVDFADLLDVSAVDSTAAATSQAASAPPEPASGQDVPGADGTSMPPLTLAMMALQEMQSHDDTAATAAAPRTDGIPSRPGKSGVTGPGTATADDAEAPADPGKKADVANPNAAVLVPAPITAWPVNADAGSDQQTSDAGSIAPGAAARRAAAAADAGSAAAAAALQGDEGQAADDQNSKISSDAVPGSQGADDPVRSLKSAKADATHTLGTALAAEAAADQRNGQQADQASGPANAAPGVSQPASGNAAAPAAQGSQQTSQQVSLATRILQRAFGPSRPSPTNDAQPAARGRTDGPPDPPDATSKADVGAIGAATQRGFDAPKASNPDGSEHQSGLEKGSAPLAPANNQPPSSAAPSSFDSLVSAASLQTAPLAASDPSSPPPSSSAAPIPVSGVAVEIVSQAQAGNHHFQIRLDPPELGRIDVRLDIDSSGTLRSHVIADRPATLDLLRHDQHQLERALSDAGFKPADNGLQFSLRDQSFSQQQQPRDSGQNQSARVFIPDVEVTPAELSRNYARPGASSTGLDIRV